MKLAIVHRYATNYQGVPKVYLFDPCPSHSGPLRSSSKSGADLPKRCMRIGHKNDSQATHKRPKMRMKTGKTRHAYLYCFYGHKLNS